MKYLSLILVCLCFTLTLSSQEQIVIEGETVDVITEANGKLDFLYKLEDRTYRYFIRKEDNTIIELKGDEYKEQLARLVSDTNLSPEKVKFTKTGLKKFVDAYNKKRDVNYQITDTSRVEFWLMPFAGITNNPFITNETNSLFGQFGAEIEIRERNISPRSAVYMKVRHVLNNDDLDYSTTEIALGYRYRFKLSEKFYMFPDVKFATLNFVNATLPVEDEEGEISILNFRDTNFDVPFIFGIGLDYQISETGFITFNFNEIVAANLKNQGNFSTNFTLGYRFSL
ncbi:MAG: hypothetical protein AAF688_12435 [Bacteroidota bacterium]